MFTSSLGSLAITKCLLNIFLVLTLQVQVTVHLKISKEFTSHYGGFLVFGYVCGGQRNATLPSPALNVHILILGTCEYVILYGKGTLLMWLRTIR